MRFMPRMYTRHTCVSRKKRTPTINNLRPWHPSARSSRKRKREIANKDAARSTSGLAAHGCRLIDVARPTKGRGSKTGPRYLDARDYGATNFGRF